MEEVINFNRPDRLSSYFTERRNEQIHIGVDTHVPRSCEIRVSLRGNIGSAPSSGVSSPMSLGSGNVFDTKNVSENNSASVRPRRAAERERGGEARQSSVCGDIRRR